MGLPDIVEESFQSNAKHSETDSCHICFELMGEFDVSSSVKPPCCRNGWFHKECLRKFAENARIEFKCPMCNDERKFCQKMIILGIDFSMR